MVLRQPRWEMRILLEPTGGFNVDLFVWFTFFGFKSDVNVNHLICHRGFQYNQDSRLTV